MLDRRYFLKSSIFAGLGLLLTSFRKLALFSKPNARYNILLGRPTDRSITLSILPKQDGELYISYGTDRNLLNARTGPWKVKNGTPVETRISNLEAGKRYYYQVGFRPGNQTEYIKEDICSFHTQRKKNDPFVFTITADSHLGTAKHCDPELYQQTLDNVATDKPDLHFALGDEFRASKVNGPDYPRIEKLYVDQREHLGTLCHSVPYFFILGNHELEAKAFYNGTDDCLAAWSARARKKFIPNPLPDHFYCGNTGTDALEMERQNYFAFEWGDALFVTLDVFWYSGFSAADEEMREQKKEFDEGLSKEERQKQREERQKNKQEGKGNKSPDGQKKKDQWAFTIGQAQYDWFKQTLGKSKARYKFVMGHHVLGSCRGGVEWASTFEWGGKNRKGLNEFNTYRPGWEMPIHDLMVKHGVTAFFQGHDHLFVRQELDGVAYITCPMCGDPGYNMYNADRFESGDKLSNTGHLRVEVDSTDVKLFYIKSVLPKDEPAQGRNAQTVFAWSFINKKNIALPK